MISQTSGSPGIGDTGSGNAAYISGFGHDGCHDTQIEERIRALTLLVPSVFSFVVVISWVIRAEMISA